MTNNMQVPISKRKFLFQYLGKERSDTDILLNFDFFVPFWKQRNDVCSKIKDLGDTYSVFNECECVRNNFLYSKYNVRLIGPKKNVKFVVGLI